MEKELQIDSCTFTKELHTGMDPRGGWWGDCHPKVMRKATLIHYPVPNAISLNNVLFDLRGVGVWIDGLRWFQYLVFVHDTVCLPYYAFFSCHNVQYILIDLCITSTSTLRVYNAPCFTWFFVVSAWHGEDWSWDLVWREWLVIAHLRLWPISTHGRRSRVGAMVYFLTW